jgi:hypothetical protein
MVELRARREVVRSAMILRGLVVVAFRGWMVFGATLWRGAPCSFGGGLRVDVRGLVAAGARSLVRLGLTQVYDFW